MATRTGNGQVIEQGKVVEAEHFDQQERRFLVLGQVEPAIEGFLCPPGSAVDTGDAVLGERRIVALGDKGNLVAQVSQPVIHRGRRKHQDACFHTFADDLAHQAVVARFVALTRRLFVAEVVRLVDHHQVVIAPVDVRQVDIPGVAAIA